jgi:hypothetical protein
MLNPTGEFGMHFPQSMFEEITESEREMLLTTKERFATPRDHDMRSRSRGRTGLLEMQEGRQAPDRNVAPACAATAT